MTSPDATQDIDLIVRFGATVSRNTDGTQEIDDRFILEIEPAGKSGVTIYGPELQKVLGPEAYTRLCDLLAHNLEDDQWENVE